MAEDEQPGEPMNGDYEFYKEVTVEAAASERRKAA
jgi:hypothetical protein